MIYLLLSNDYEVFLGGNRAPEGDVLCAPTDRLLDVLADTQASMTFFCDVACLWRYREQGFDAFPDRVERQLRDIIAHGHDVQAHIHPHWLFTDLEQTADGIRYSIDPVHFSLAGSAARQDVDPGDLAEMLARRAKTYLEALLRPVKTDYRCHSYRAGGYGIQPRSRDILAGLRRAGLIIDSSVVPGMVLTTNVNDIDFRCLPDTANYWTEEIGPRASAIGSGLFEVPVAAGLVGAWPLAAATLRRLRRRRAEGGFPGYGIQQLGEPAGARRLAAKVLMVLRRIARGWDMLELGMDARHMLAVTERFLIDHRHEDPVFLSFSCHSKTISPAKLEAMRDYLDALRRQHGDDLRLVTFSDLADILDGRSGQHER